MQYYVYILSNKSHTVLYIGVTGDLVRRIHEHKTHADPKSFTSQYHATKLVYYEYTTDIKTALEREKQIKSWNRRRKEELVDSMNPERKDLYGTIIE